MLKNKIKTTMTVLFDKLIDESKLQNNYNELYFFLSKTKLYNNKNPQIITLLNSISLTLMKGSENMTHGGHESSFHKDKTERLIIEVMIVLPGDFWIDTTH